MNKYKYTSEEDAIIAKYTLLEAVRRLRTRTYSSVERRRYTLKDKGVELLDNDIEITRTSPYIIPGLSSRTIINLDNLLISLKLTDQEIKGKRKFQSIILKKKIFCYIAKERTKYNLEQIGDKIGVTHANVLYHYNDVVNKLAIGDKKITGLIENLKNL